MEQTQSKLTKGIGTKEMESTKLEVKPVKVVNAEIQEVKKDMEKVILKVKHPDKEEPIEISSTKFERDKALKVVGLWYQEDADGLIQKGSALAVTLAFYNAENLAQLINKEVNTVAQDSGYLAIKAY